MRNDLGLNRRIPRRDFLDGVALTLGGLASGLSPAAGAEEPSARTGLRGQENAAYVVAHSLRDGTFWGTAGSSRRLRETYDLVVVGGGISGLAAAYFYRRRAPGARVLVLENLDDFGGHAQRNEFRVGRRVLLSNGGTQSIYAPRAYSAVATGLLTELGIVCKRFERYFDRRRYDGLGTGVFFDRETFGTDRLVAGMGSKPWATFLAQTPLTPSAKRDIERIYTEAVDYLPHLAPQAKRTLLERTSYADFLVKIAGCDPSVLPFFKSWTNDLFALEIEAVSAAEAFDAGDDYELVVFPGFAGIDLGGGARAERIQQEPYIYHFPDGNASITRLLVRKLIPGAIDGHTMEDVVTARVRYARLDDSTNPVRIRLGSTAVRVENRERSADVEVSYVRDGTLESVRAKACVLACWNAMTPYLCPEIPKEQQEALAYGVKAPLVYTHVAIRSWEPLSRACVRAIHAPGSYHSLTMLDFPVSMGTYRSPRTPAEPMVLWLLRTPCRPGLPPREQYRAGRAELYTTPFALIEHNTRSQLQRMLGPTGFDASRDIAAITVNRWAHGYAYTYMSMWDPIWKPGESPCERGRKTIGRIAIANSDAAASAYTDAAIDQAHRAVTELLRVSSTQVPITAANLADLQESLHSRSKCR